MKKSVFITVIFAFLTTALAFSPISATPADAALMMQLGVDGVFVGSGIFKSEDPATTANAIDVMNHPDTAINVTLANSVARDSSTPSAIQP